MRSTIESPAECRMNNPYLKINDSFSCRTNLWNCLFFKYGAMIEMLKTHKKFSFLFPDQ